jgi:membrane-anchored protein YejM (alkaline phosphatase superfamily)
MNNSTSGKEFTGSRFVYFKYISQSYLPPLKQEEMTHFDVAPTILTSLNLMHLNDSDFGLGQSIFAENRDLKLWQRNLDRRILNPSKTYNKFWGY